ncbi:MAG TPA: ester cyclase [Anaerolineae bacterium]|nr:ester cyclase [Anaerolineae bacterium]HXV99013.1 ester cyclase [Anaerolineae bacterium]
MSTETTKNIVRRYIEEVWNKQDIGAVEEFLAENYVDHSLPPEFKGREGVKQWVKAVSTFFDEQTIIEDQVTEADKTILRLTMRLTHRAEWRGIPATGKQVEINGYRTYRLEGGKIVEHWALIDGDSLERQLRAVN